MEAASHKVAKNAKLHIKYAKQLQKMQNRLKQADGCQF